ncbi:hypothetical protein CHCC14820_4081 [Bacillus paralicheniformis]|uniref:DNA sulfur modification protein DndB n=1 Tax=Bacillus paralicheniformis TaxID=1648923 RepID=A0AAW6K6K1_9BACI|nr:DNA sulfur modification protein DndB [Bacillus paralicheniformis]MDE1451112.1 DNA sulfur modification protein DndB [Bacillus paralicheniformis]TWM36038.1 hypothetical protein CHCC14820_4081 [Bacillus paralicheniformis]
MENKVITRFKGQKCNQFGREVLLTQLPYFYLESIFEVDEHVQRSLDTRKRNEISDFILNTVETEDLHFSSFVFSARNQLRKVNDGWEVNPGTSLYILDGQHRSKGLGLAIKKLEVQLASPLLNQKEVKSIEQKIQKLKHFQVSMQIYLDLDEKSERQLFADINTERREPHSGLIVRYDQRDTYAKVTRELTEELKDLFEIEENKSRITKYDSALTTMVTIRKCLIAMFEGALQEKEINKNAPVFGDQIKSISSAFLKKWLEIFPERMNNREIYCCGIPGIQISLAFTVFRLTRVRKISHLEAISLLGGLAQKCSWRHDDSLFSDFFDKEKKRLIGCSNVTAINKLANIFLGKI